MSVKHYYKEPWLSDAATEEKLTLLKKSVPNIVSLDTELCFNVGTTAAISHDVWTKLKWLLSDSVNHGDVSKESKFVKPNEVIEIGPRLNFSTPFSSNAVSICHSMGLGIIERLEVSIRYHIVSKNKLSKEERSGAVAALHDRMTQCEYPEPLSSFSLGIQPEPWFCVDVMGQGRKALEDVNQKLGLAFDSWDLSYYTQLFKEKLKRNPTSVECFDLAQSNSEHSRHWFFKGHMIVDDIHIEDSLIDMIMETQNYSNPNNVIKFSDNSSSINGFNVYLFRPESSVGSSPFEVKRGVCDLIFTAETHNFPTGVAPFSGATTGTGGRLRDVQSVGRGGFPIAGTAGYSVGNLNIPGYKLPWEDDTFTYPNNFALPLDILVEASNGASDYGNKFGEPVITGFARSFGLSLPGGRREYIKPIMFSGGLGYMDHDMHQKLTPERGMRVVKVGGPVYRIGVGGGAASSVEVQGDNKAELDFGAVQRGDAEMEQKLNRVIRGCLEMGVKNPILSIHDQGAGGNGNVLKELVEPAGAVIFSRLFSLGDPSISALELWGAEYQESNALLCRAEDVPILQAIALRERCPIDVVGTVTGTGKVVLNEGTPDLDGCLTTVDDDVGKHPVNLDLGLVLGKMPRKEYHLKTIPTFFPNLVLPHKLRVEEALDRVFRLVNVGSKRFLTNKVDRCVTGLIAQQQCVGPLHTPLADVAVTALSHFNTEGIATSIGEQPIKGLVDAGAGARMSVAEALSNLVFAVITDLKDVKCSGNWMWAAKLEGEGATLVAACTAMCSFMNKLGIAVDGGKDSLSMAARVGEDCVKAPGTLVISAYAPCPDIRKVITPDLKETGSTLFWISLSHECRLAGSALAQCYGQVGNKVPDVEDPEMLVRAFNVIQNLIKEGRLLSGHDISDGGLITAILEMCFAGIHGTTVNISTDHSSLNVLFAEEVGWVLEVRSDQEAAVKNAFKEAKVQAQCIGSTGARGMDARALIQVNGKSVIDKPLHILFSLWESTSYQLELKQASSECVNTEFSGLKLRTGPNYKLSFEPDKYLLSMLHHAHPKVAVLREEGSNGDREMAASLFQAGFEVHDVTMQDLLLGRTGLTSFRGIVFPGGFSYADVLGSAKGWGGCLQFHPTLTCQFQLFSKRADTFSLGVCNGCQVMAYNCFINMSDGNFNDVVLEKNDSERFECRFSTVRIECTPAIMLRGMEGSVLGIWVAHGEGKFNFRSNYIQEKYERTNCVALRYVDDDGFPTEVYPMNPNGSPSGIAGVCSRDGRHLAMMPHPERCTELWQLPYKPKEWEHLNHSPWSAMFRNAMEWCTES